MYVKAMTSGFLNGLSSFSFAKETLFQVMLGRTMKLVNRLCYRGHTYSYTFVVYLDISELRDVSFCRCDWCCDNILI